MSRPEEEVTEQKAAGESGREVLVREQSVWLVLGIMTGAAKTKLRREMDAGDGEQVTERSGN